MLQNCTFIMCIIIQMFGLFHMKDKHFVLFNAEIYWYIQYTLQWPYLHGNSLVDF